MDEQHVRSIVGSMLEAWMIDMVMPELQEMEHRLAKQTRSLTRVTQTLEHRSDKALRRAAC
jgi:hypothetical protein